LNANTNGRSAANLVMRVCDIGEFFRALRVRMRFGELSRAPLRLLRIEVRGDGAECEWMARAADSWDDGLPNHVSECHVSMQALEDAIAVRELLLRTLPDVESAALRVFRLGVTGDPELVIIGTVAREERPIRYFHSVAMRAKLLGLQFWLEDGILGVIPQENLTAEAQAGYTGDLLSMGK
jgi:hypothetical protein